MLICFWMRGLLRLLSKAAKAGTQWIALFVFRFFISFLCSLEPGRVCGERYISLQRTPPSRFYLSREKHSNTSDTNQSSVDLLKPTLDHLTHPNINLSRHKNQLLATLKMSNQSTTQSSQANFTSSSTFSSQKPTYAPSIQSTTSSFQSYKPLLDTESPSSTSTSTPSKNSKAWKKTKKFLSSLGEPPTAEYDRQQDAKKGIKTNGREAFGAINYGPYRTSTFGGERALGRI